MCIVISGGCCRRAFCGDSASAVTVAVAVSCSPCFALTVRVGKVHTCESVEESVKCGR